MKEPKAVYKRFLIAAIVLYVVGVCLIQIDVQVRLGRIEHAMSHAGYGHQHGK